MWPARLSGRQEQGRLWEQRVLSHLVRHGLELVDTNYRCHCGEVDLILRDGETLVFVEVRQRADGGHGGAAASIGPAKMRRLVNAAHTYLQRLPKVPPCRIDVVAIDGDRMAWIRNAIQAP